MTIDDPTPLADVTACRACGYLIAGLPPVGLCPECGGPYDRHELVLFGRRRGGTWLLASWTLVAAALVVSVASPHRGRPHLIWGVVQLVPILGWVAALSDRLFAGRPGTSRLRMSTRGCTKDVEPPPPPWPMVVARLVRAVVGRRPDAGPAAVWVMGKPVRWGAIARLTLDPARGGSWRLRAVPAVGWMESPKSIDVTFAATPEQVAAVRAFAGRFTTVSASEPSPAGAPPGSAAI